MALAKAELEYPEGHISRIFYAIFKVVKLVDTATESGIGLVHTALGHSQEDFLTSMKYKILIFSPIDDNDNFTKETRQFDGLDVLGDENVAIVKILDEHSCLIMEEAYK